MRRAVLDLKARRDVWRLPPWAVREIRRGFGAGWQVEELAAFADSDGDGSGSLAAARAVRGAEVYVGFGIAPDVAAAGRGSLRWVHSAAAGIGASLSPALRATGARFTNSAGIHAEPLADWTITAIGMCLRGMHLALDGQRQRRWTKDAFTRAPTPVREFAGTRVGIVGLGGIGSAVARRCAALDMEVRAIRRHPGRPRPKGVRWVGGPGAVRTLARQSDVLVLSAPRTGRTDGLIDAAVLRALPAGAYVINLGRGALLDEAALRVQLDRGRLAGCVLDVFRHEPLPRSHWAWRHPRVVVTPHVGAVSSRFWERQTALVIENARRYRAGKPLRNVVRWGEGY
ncbi:MAG TPA: NAD(P)-dependent oxidoreductase [Gemmatimonadales bacterium]